jgi:hypothetical protein
MYWTIGKILALLPVMIIILSPFVGRLRRAFLKTEMFEDWLYWDFYDMIEEKKVDNFGLAFNLLLGIIGLFILATAVYWLVVATYPILIVVMVVIWALKKLYSNKNKV